MDTNMNAGFKNKSNWYTCLYFTSYTTQTEQNVQMNTEIHDPYFSNEWILGGGGIDVK